MTTVWHDAALVALGDLAADERVAAHHHSDWWDWAAITDDPSWSTGERAVLSWAQDVYTGGGAVGTLAQVDGDTRVRLVSALSVLFTEIDAARQEER